MGNELFSEALNTLETYQAEERFPTPTYMPAFLNALRSSEQVSDLANETNKSLLETALKIGMVVIRKALQARIDLNEEI